MCLLTTVKTPDGWIISHSRDENQLRARALEPQEVLINGQIWWYPIDPQSGGTWIASSQTKTYALLNGGHVNHMKAPKYRRSRGEIILDLINGKTLNDIHLIDFEPFRLFEISDDITENIWTGEKLLIHPSQENIWASATLYEKEKVDDLKEKFEEIKNLNNGSIKDFHLRNKLELINQKGTIRTQNLVQISPNSKTFLQINS